MAKYTINFHCGHTAEMYIEGSTKDKERRIAYLEKYGVCPACYKKEQEEKREKAAKSAHEWAMQCNLPELTGTEKQIKWGETLRQEILIGIIAECKLMLKSSKNKEEYLELANKFKTMLKWMRDQEEAKFWIESRDYLVNDYLYIMPK